MSRYLYGLDLGMSCTGVTIYDLDEKDFVYIGSLDTEGIKKKKGFYLHALKLLAIADFLLELQERYPPYTVAIERGFSRFNLSTQVVYRVHGLVNYLFRDFDQVYYPPKMVKLALLHGNATKKQLQDVILANYDYVSFANEDESDSFAVVLTYLIKNELIVFEKPLVQTKRKTPKKPKKEA